MKGLWYFLKDLLISILITVIIVYGCYWLAFDTGDPGYSGLRLSIMLCPLMLIAAFSSVGLAVLFFIYRYFNRFITILCMTFLAGVNWCEVVVEPVRSWNDYFESGLSMYMIMGFTSLLVVGIGKIVIWLKIRRRP